MNFANTSLFIGDLPKFCNEVDLEQLFAPFGPILDVKIKRNVNTGKTLSYGFVTFSSEATASEALRRLDGTMFYGRKLRLRWAMYNARSHSGMFNGVINSVYVRFVTSRVDQFITEEDLHRVFEPFGTLVDVSIKESSVDPRLNRQSGYGFVHYACDSDGVEAAFQAVSAVDNAVIDGVTYNVELSKNLLRQFNENNNNNNNNNNSNGNSNDAYASSAPNTAPPSPSFPPSPSLGGVGGGREMRGPTPPLSGARIPLPPPSPGSNNNNPGMSPSSSLAHLPTSGYRSAGNNNGRDMAGSGANGVAMMQDFPHTHAHAHAHGLSHSHSHSRHSSRSASPSLSLSAVSPSAMHTMRGPSPLRLPPQHPLTPTGNGGGAHTHFGARQSPSPAAMGLSRMHAHTHAQSPQSYRSSSPSSALVGIAALSTNGGNTAVPVSVSASGVPPPPPLPERTYRSPHNTHAQHAAPLGLPRSGSGSINMNINVNNGGYMNGTYSPALSLRSASPSSQTSASYLDPHSHTHGLSLAHTSHSRVSSGGSAAGSVFFDGYNEGAHAPTPPLSGRMRGYSHEMVCPPSPLSAHSHTHSLLQPHSGHHSLSTSPSASFLDAHMYSQHAHTHTHTQHSSYTHNGAGLGLDVYYRDSDSPANTAAGIMNSGSNLHSYNNNNSNSYYNSNNINGNNNNNNAMSYEQYYANSSYYSPRVNTPTQAQTQTQSFFPVAAANGDGNNGLGEGIAGGMFAAEDAALRRQYELEQAALREREIDRDRDLFFGLQQQSALESLISTDLTHNTQEESENTSSVSAERERARERAKDAELDALIDDHEWTQETISAKALAAMHERKERKHVHGSEEALRDASNSFVHLSLTLSDDEQP